MQIIIAVSSGGSERRNARSLADRARLEQAKREGPPVWNAMLRDYEERRLMGDSSPKPRGEVTDGEAKYGQH